MTTDATEQLPTSQAEDRTSNALAKVGIGPGAKISAFIPTTLDETWRLATIIARSGMAPKAYKSPEQVMVGIMAGLEVGLSPFTALQSIAVIGGNPSVWGDGALALVEASMLLEWIKEEFDEAAKIATCAVKRVGKPEATVRTFSFDDAQKANLLNKEGPWRGYPKRMCQMRARAFALRDTFADVLKGLKIREEVEDYAETGQTRTTPEPRLSSSMLFDQATPAEPTAMEGMAHKPEDIVAPVQEAGGNPFAKDPPKQTTAEALGDDLPEHSKGPAPADDKPVWANMVAVTKSLVPQAGDHDTLARLEVEFEKHKDALPSEVFQEVIDMVAARFAELAETKSAKKGG